MTEDEKVIYISLVHKINVMHNNLHLIKESLDKLLLLNDIKLKQNTSE